jgi:heme exporter protein C
VGFVDVPIVYYSVQWWRAIHPAPVVGPASEPGSLAPAMLVTLVFSLVTFTLFFVVLLRERLVLKATEEALGEARDLTRRATSDTRSVR